MDKLKAIFVSMMVVMISMGCAPRRAAEPYNPFKIDAVQFHSRVKTIALAPIRLPEGMPEAEAIKSQFEASIEKELRQAGYHVIPSRTYKEVEERKAREAGGYYDIKTGAPDEEKYKSVQQQVRKELHITHQAEGFLYSAVRIVPVRFMGGTVFWHGTQETISKTGKRSEANKQGTVGALSLGLWIDDHEGADLYANWGGIQLLSKLEDKGRVFISLKFSPVPEEEIMADKARNEKAVGIALGPLLKKPQP